MTSKHNLRIVHVCEDMSISSGGVPAVIRPLVKSISAFKKNIVTMHSIGDSSDLTAISGSSVFKPIKCYPFWYWSPEFNKYLSDLADNANYSNIFHIHGPWSAPQYIASKLSHEKSVPAIFSSHGMLDPWRINGQGYLSSFKKNFYLKYIAIPNFSKSHIIHAITPLEKSYLQVLFPKNRIEIIPNCIDVEQIPSTNSSKRKQLLFLGRIEPVKGVHLLIEAFRLAQIDNNWTLNIAGPIWNKAYYDSLVSYVFKYKLHANVNFLGPVFGVKKNTLLDESWAMFVPSFSEAVGLVNLESAARCLPSVTTHSTGLFDWEDGGGILVNNDIYSLKESIERVCKWTINERHIRGLSSYNLVNNKYSWKRVSKIWNSLYEDIAK